jgi:hypothetical protein
MRNRGYTNQVRMVRVRSNQGFYTIRLVIRLKPSSSGQCRDAKFRVSTGLLFSRVDAVSNRPFNDQQ